MQLNGRATARGRPAASAIAQRERFHRKHARTAFLNAEGTCIPRMSGERDFYEFLESVESLSHRIRDRADADLRSYVPPELTEAFLALAMRLDSIASVQYDHHRIKPDVEIVLDMLRSTSSMLSGLLHQDGDPMGCRQLVHLCISRCSGMLRSPEAKKARKRFDQLQRQNASSCRKYFDSLIRKSPRLFVSRVDLYAPVTGPWWRLADFLAAEDAIDRLILRLRKGAVVESLLGSAVVRESGFCRGMHYSVLVAQGGYAPRDGYEIATAVGRDWIGLFGGTGVLAKASYFESYSLRQPEQFNGLGLIDIDDHRARIALYAAIDGAWDVPIVFDAEQIRDNTYKNPSGVLAGIHRRNLRKGINAGN